MATKKQIGIAIFTFLAIFTISLIANGIFAVELILKNREAKTIMWSLKRTDIRLSNALDSAKHYKNQLDLCKEWINITENRSEIVKASVYNATEKQCNKDYLHTASMFKLDSTNQYKHRIIAVSRDLLNKFPIGSKVYIKGTNYDGVWNVQDKMSKKYHKQIDLLINEDMDIGKWNDVLIELYYD